MKKTPRLAIVNGYYCCNFYRPDKKRSTMSFGPVNGGRPASEVHAAFERWIELYEELPDKVLDFKSPYEAVEAIINPTARTSIKEFVTLYIQWCKNILGDGPRGRKVDPLVERLQRLEKFLTPYLDWRVSEFGDAEVLAIQHAMAEHRYQTKGGRPKAYTRSGINRLINDLRKMWRWGLSYKITTDDRCSQIEHVRPLRPGQQVGESVMRDNIRRPMITLEEVTKIAEQLNPIRADILWLLWYTGARPGEVCQMRPVDIVKGDPDCWLYVPGSDVGPSSRHKTSYRGRVHVIPLAGPAKAILERRVTQWDSKEYVFQPAQSMQEWHGRQLLRRDTPLSTGNRPGTNRTGDSLIKPGACFKPVSLNTAFHRACDRAGVAPFTPYDLRRSTATRVRALIDKDAAKALLGHSSTNTTDIYLLDEVTQAVKVAKILAHG